MIGILGRCTWASVSREPLSMRREWGRPAPLVASVPHPKRVSVPKASPKAGPTAASPKAGHPRDTGLTQCGTHASMPHPMWDACLGASPNLTLLPAASPNAGQIRPLPHPKRDKLYCCCSGHSRHKRMSSTPARSAWPTRNAAARSRFSA